MKKGKLQKNSMDEPKKTMSYQGRPKKKNKKQKPMLGGGEIKTLEQEKICK